MRKGAKPQAAALLRTDKAASFKFKIRRSSIFGKIGQPPSPRADDHTEQRPALRRGSALALSAQLPKFAQPFKSNAQIWANAT